jgi:hypothetical protein
VRAWILAAACVLAACSAEAPSAPDATQSIAHIEAEARSNMTLSCVEFATITPETLAQRFGAEHITTEILPGAEGDTYEATVLHPYEPALRLEIVWNDAGDRPSAISVKNVGAWRGSEGYTIGTSLADVERMNGRAFQLYGFGWYYGGWVSNWNGGALEYEPTCRAHVRFAPRVREDINAMGDRQFQSDNAAIRAADPVVREFGLTFPIVQ